MKSNTLTPFDLFGNQVRYTVPLFQRPYVWTRDLQWEPLWDDVRTVAERIIENREAQVSGGKPTQAIPHFLGAIVLDQKMVPTGFIQERHVIDGQQRLTTLQLLMDAAQEVVEEWGSPADASALQSLVLNNVNQVAGPDQLFKVWPTNYDREAFRAAMSNEIEVPENLRSSSIVAAHAFFRSEIEEWAEVTGDPEKAGARLNALALALSQYLLLVVIDLEEGDNAQVIFETLNHRGTPLLAADLVKNLVFRRAEDEGLDVEALYERWWERFDSKYWRDGVGAGRHRRPRIDVFLNYWLVMRKAHEVPADRVFTDFSDYLRLEHGGIDDVVADLSRYAEIYEDLQHREPHSVEGTFSYRVLNVLDQGILTPVVIWLFGHAEEGVSEADRQQALRMLESWAVRRMILRRSNRGLNRFVIDLLKELDSRRDEPAGLVVSEVLLASGTETSDWPGDEEIVRTLAEVPIYRVITRARLRMLLEALEDDRRTPKTEEAHCRRNLTIEHIMPQGWREHWPLPGREAAEVEAVRRDLRVQRLGNLTLVNDRLNPSLSNRPWTDSESLSRGLGDQGKRSALADHSVLLLNQDVIQQNPESWDEERMAERGRALAERIIQIWPRG